MYNSQFLLPAPVASYGKINPPLGLPRCLDRLIQERVKFVNIADDPVERAIRRILIELYR